jgi:putative FmdB family regulatory protein
MPLYDYRCATCGALFEHLQTPGEPDPAASPCCQAPVTRALSVPADFRGRFQAPRCSSCMEGDTPRDLPPCQGAGGCCAGDEDESPT